MNKQTRTMTVKQVGMWHHITTVVSLTVCAVLFGFILGIIVAVNWLY